MLLNQLMSFSHQRALWLVTYAADVTSRNQQNAIRLWHNTTQNPLHKIIKQNFVLCMNTQAVECYITECSQPKGTKTKMRRYKLGSGVKW